MTRIVATMLVLSSVLFSLNALAQGTSGNKAPSSHQLQPPKYVPGQAEEAPEQIVRQRRTIGRKDKGNHRDITRLYRIMAVEGSEFSQEKYDSYRKRMEGGVTFVVLGSIALFSSALVGISAFFGSFEYHGDGYDCSQDSSCGEEDDEYQTKRRAALGLLTGGLVGIAFGIPLIVSGRRGKNRQNYLRMKDRILAPVGCLRVGLSFDPSTNAGGLSLSATF